MPARWLGVISDRSRTQDTGLTCRQAEGADLLEDVDAAEGEPNRDESGTHDSEARDAETADNDDYDAGARGAASRSSVRWAGAFGLVVVLSLAVLVGWLGYGTYESYQTGERHDFFLAAGRQAALDLTSINYTEADADVQRILKSATGSFYQDFQRRAPAFIDVVKQMQSKSTGTVMAAGLESQKGDRAQVLVTVSVASSTAAVTDQPARIWRMRIHLRQMGGDAKVFNVEFVP